MRRCTRCQLLQGSNHTGFFSGRWKAYRVQSEWANECKALRTVEGDKERQRKSTDLFQRVRQLHRQHQPWQRQTRLAARPGRLQSLSTPSSLWDCRTHRNKLTPHGGEKKEYQRRRRKKRKTPRKRYKKRQVLKIWINADDKTDSYLFVLENFFFFYLPRFGCLKFWRFCPNQKRWKNNTRII